MEVNETVGDDHALTKLLDNGLYLGNQDYKCYPISEAAYLVNEWNKVYNATNGFTIEYTYN